MAKDWYDENVWLNVLWMISGIVWLPIWVVAFINYGLQDKELPKWIRWWMVASWPEERSIWHSSIYWVNPLNCQFTLGHNLTV